MAAEMIETGIIDSDGHRLFVRIPANLGEVGIVAVEDKKIKHSIYIKREYLPTLIKKLEDAI